MKSLMRAVITGALVLSFCGSMLAQTKAATPQASIARTHKANIQDHSFTSKALGRETRYRILLPKGYDETTRRFPVLYLLHGLLGGYENWETRTNLTDYAANLPMIIVMPDAGNSWYVNSATQPQEKMEDYIVEDLIPEIDRTWRTIRSPHRRAIAGLSMGGYGALKFALKYPEMFAVAASISGAISAPLELDVQRSDFRDDLQKVFGGEGSATRKDNDVIRLALAAKPASMPYLYMVCGSSDFLLDSNRRFATALSENKIEYEYHESPGAHTWAFWDNQLPTVLELVNKKIGLGISAR